MILAGLKPEIIMEIAARAIAFWTYQVKISYYQTITNIYLFILNEYVLYMVSWVRIYGILNATL